MFAAIINISVLLDHVVNLSKDVLTVGTVGRLKSIVEKEAGMVMAFIFEKRDGIINTFINLE